MPGESSGERSEDAAGGEPRAPWVVLALVAGSVLLSTMDASIINIALPTLASEFGTTIDAVIWVVLVFVLLGTGLALPFGRLGDLFGRKRFYVAGNAVAALGLLACGLAPSLPALVAARGLQAVGNAMVVSNGNAIVTAAVAPQHRGQALGIIGGVVGIGLASGPVLGGIFIELLNWRAIFLARLPLSLTLTALLWLVLRDTSSEGRDRGLDIAGSLALFGSLASLTLAVNRGHAWGWSSPPIIGLFALGLVLAPLFVLIERRAASPVVSLELLRIRAFSGSVGSAILFFWGFGAVLVLMPFYLVDARGFSTLEAGAVLAAQPLTLFVFAPLTGRLADRTGPRLLVPLGLASRESRHRAARARRRRHVDPRRGGEAVADRPRDGAVPVAQQLDDHGCRAGAAPRHGLGGDRDREAHRPGGRHRGLRRRLHRRRGRQPRGRRCGQPAARPRDRGRPRGGPAALRRRRRLRDRGLLALGHGLSGGWQRAVPSPRGRGPG